MGASASKSKTKTRVFDRESLSGIIQGLEGFSQNLQGSQGFTPQLQGIGGFNQAPSLGQAPTLGLGQGGLTSGEQQSFDAQLGAIDAGSDSARQAISQSVRERSAATGFGGDSTSRGAIAEEAARLGQFEQTQGAQRANVFGQQGQMQRQGLLAGAQFGLQARGQDLQQRGQNIQSNLQARQQDLQFGGQQLQAQQFGQQNRFQDLQLALQALNQAGGLAGITQQTGSKKSFTAGKFG